MPDLTASLREAVLRAGCSVIASVDSLGAVRCECPDVGAKVQLMNGIALLASDDPSVASFALTLRLSWHDDREFAEGLVRWVSEHVRWIEEPGERFQWPGLTLATLIGDCDCSAMLVAACCLATGLAARLVGLVDDVTGDGHAVAQCDGWAIGRGEDWTWLEASTRGIPIGTDPRTLMVSG